MSTHTHAHKNARFRIPRNAKSSIFFPRWFLLTEWHVLISFLFHNKCEFTGSYIICNYEHTEQPELCSTAMGGWNFFLCSVFTLSITEAVLISPFTSKAVELLMEFA